MPRINQNIWTVVHIDSAKVIYHWKTRLCLNVLLAFTYFTNILPTEVILKMDHQSQNRISY